MAATVTNIIQIINSTHTKQQRIFGLRLSTMIMKHHNLLCQTRRQDLFASRDRVSAKAASTHASLRRFEFVLFKSMGHTLSYAYFLVLNLCMDFFARLVAPASALRFAMVQNSFAPSVRFLFPSFSIEDLQRQGWLYHKIKSKANTLRGSYVSQRKVLGFDFPGSLTALLILSPVLPATPSWKQS